MEFIVYFCNRSNQETRNNQQKIRIMNAAKVLENLKRRFPNEPEYHQAVEEVLSTIEEEYNNIPNSTKQT